MVKTGSYPRVDVTDAAASLVRDLTVQHGPLMFHQSGGCCDGSSPMCFPVGMFLTGPSDVLLGALDVGLDADAVDRASLASEPALAADPSGEQVFECCCHDSSVALVGVSVNQ